MLEVSRKSNTGLSGTHIHNSFPHHHAKHGCLFKSHPLFFHMHPNVIKV